MDASSAYEDLAVVRRLMEEARDVAWEYARHVVVWGVIGAAALLLTYASVRGAAVPGMGWTWAVALLAGWLFSAWAVRREAGRARIRTTAGRMLGGIWLGFGITATLIALLGLYARALELEALGGIMAALLGFAFFASGHVGRQGWVRWPALGWWAGAAVMLAWPGAHTLPLMAGLLVLLQVAPAAVILVRGRRAAGSGPA